MRSMFSGVSGLKAHQTKMDVVGNNVANVNTIGYKSSRVTFEEVFSQTLKGASAPDSGAGRGGVNPMQVGLGIGVSGIDTITTRGSLERTDNPTDLSIEGEGYFIVNGGGGAYKFTRAGNFGIDKLGNLVSGSGLNVYGWQEYTRNTDGTYEFDTETPIEPVNLYNDDVNKNKRMIAAKATTSSSLSGNLDASKVALGTGNETADNVHFTIPMTVYDSLGNDYKVELDMWKIEVAAGPPITSQWSWQLNSGAGATAGATGTILFDADGQIVTGDALNPINPTITMTPDATIGSDAFDVELDLSKATMYKADSSLKPTDVDGYGTGNLVTFSIGNDGVITGIYSNGQQQPLGMLGLALFENPAGLQKVGNNMFLPTTNSGDFKKATKAGAEGSGTLNPGTLEMSNVDLSKEFTNMIITQRGFQANSRIITASDELLQELVNLKR